MSTDSAATPSTAELALIEARIANDGPSGSTAFLLCFFLGLTGAHKFYLGQSGQGILLLLLSLSVVGLPLSAIWCLVDLFTVGGQVRRARQRMRDKMIAAGNVAEARVNRRLGLRVVLGAVSLVAIAVVGLMAFQAVRYYVIMTPAQRAAKDAQFEAERVAQARQDAIQASSSATVTPATPTQPWQYRTGEVDPMRGTAMQLAEDDSTNSVDFGFPYGVNQLEIVLRRDARSGDSIMLEIRQGQFVCADIEACSLNVKFDDGPIQRFAFDQADAGVANTIFIQNKSRFLAALQRSHHVFIEADFYGHSGEQFQFETSGLQWPPRASSPP